MRTTLELTVTGNTHYEIVERAEGVIANYLEIVAEQEDLNDVCDYELKVVPNDGPDKYIAHIHVRIK